MPHATFFGLVCLSLDLLGLINPPHATAEGLTSGHPFLSFLALLMENMAGTKAVAFTIFSMKKFQFLVFFLSCKRSTGSRNKFLPESRDGEVMHGRSLC